MRSDVIEAHSAIAQREVRWEESRKRAVGSWLVGAIILLALWIWAPVWLTLLAAVWIGYVGTRETIRASKSHDSWDRAVVRRNRLLAIQQREDRIRAMGELIEYMDRGGDPDDERARALRSEMDKPNGYYTRNWG